MSRTEESTERTYPRFLTNHLRADDLFEGQSHRHIAEQIVHQIEHNKSLRSIGIDGSWGSGKSNLVKIIEKELEGKPYHIFNFDAWGHQGDLQRRSILEELTKFLSEINICKSTEWERKRKELIAKKQETTTTHVPKLSLGIVFSFFALVLTPILDIATEGISNKLLRILIILIPVIVLFVLFIFVFVRNCRNRNYRTFRRLFTDSINQTFQVYSKDKLEYNTLETICEEEPSSIQFKKWLHDIDSDIKGHTLILVFDNMDRLPQDKVQELWAAIHSFFADEEYDNIKIIVPFDRVHIISAFKSEDEQYDEGKGKTNKQNKTKHFGDDFINKTFNVIYRVSPPIMSDWKKFFDTLWKEAFGDEKNVDSSITQIYDILTDNPTPREITAFINKFVSIKLLTKQTIPDKYIALFIFAESAIRIAPFEELITPTYLGGLKTIYGNDENLSKYMSALYYQLEPERAIDVVYLDRLKKALNSNTPEDVKHIGQLASFGSLLERAITDIPNVSNAVLSLNESQIDIDKDHWKSLYNQITKHEDTLQEYQVILLEKMDFSNEYLKKIISAFYAANPFDPVAFYNSIIQLSEKNCDPFKFIVDREIAAEQFIKYVQCTKDNYKLCHFSCDIKKLDEYLSQLDLKELDKLDIIPYIFDEYKELPHYKEHLEELINKNNNDRNHIALCYKRLKELEKPIEKTIPDNVVSSLFQNLKSGELFYYDLICMRIARYSNFQANMYNNVFSSVLSSTDEHLIRHVAEQIEYYTTYGELLLNLHGLNNYPLIIEVAKYLTLNSVGVSIMDLLSVLKKYEDILSILELDSKVFINRLNDWNNSTEKFSTQVNTIPIQFFRDAKSVQNKLTKNLIQYYETYLQSVSKEKWKESIINKGKNYQLVILFQFNIQNCYDAFKMLLEEKASGTQDIPNDTINLLVDLAVKHKRGLTTTFRNVRDTFNRQKMTAELFTTFGRLLLKYGKLEEKKESLRTIFQPSVLDKKENLLLIAEYGEIMTTLVNNADEDADDFKDNIKAKVDEYEKDESMKDFIKWAESIDIHPKSWFQKLLT